MKNPLNDFKNFNFYYTSITELTIDLNNPSNIGFVNNAIWLIKHEFRAINLNCNNVSTIKFRNRSHNSSLLER